jgi:hypothetical protein
MLWLAGKFKIQSETGAFMRSNQDASRKHQDLARQIGRVEVKKDSAFSGRGRFLKTWVYRDRGQGQGQGQEEEVEGDRALWGHRRPGLFV